MSLFPKQVPIKNPSPHAPAPDPTSASSISSMAMQLQRQQDMMLAKLREEEARLRRQRMPEEMVVAALSGWRRWSVEMFGEILLSNNLTRWEPRKKLVAECKRRERTAHMIAQAQRGLVPMHYAEDAEYCRGIDCGCGIYAYKIRDDAAMLDNAPTEKTHIFGEVWLWGRIVEHQGGYRAQYAYPKAFVRTAIAERLAYVYGAQLIN